MSDALPCTALSIYYCTFLPLDRFSGVLVYAGDFVGAFNVGNTARASSPSDLPLPLCRHNLSDSPAVFEPIITTDGTTMFVVTADEVGGALCPLHVRVSIYALGVEGVH